jgi:hypothetical protein
METIKGENGKVELEVGKVYKGTKRLINSVWTVTFAPLKDGRVVVLDYTRDDKEGYEKERELPKVSLREDDDRSVNAVVFTPHPYTADRWDVKEADRFSVANSRHVFDYSGGTHAVEDTKNYPELAKLRNKLGAKDLGLTEDKEIKKMKHVKLFESWLSESADLPKLDINQIKFSEEFGSDEISRLADLYIDTEEPSERDMAEAIAKDSGTRMGEIYFVGAIDHNTELPAGKEVAYKGGYPGAMPIEKFVGEDGTVFYLANGYDFNMLWSVNK